VLDLVKKLLDLKSLLGPEYFGDLQAMALAALAADWKGVIELGFALAEKVVVKKLFPDTLTTQAATVAEADLDATLKELEGQTAPAAVPAINPGEVIAIITLIADLIKLWRNRK
jgi:hypothetical protein